MLPFLRQSNIATLDPREQLAPHVQEDFHDTDHLTLEGSRALTAYLTSHLAPPAAP